MAPTGTVAKRLLSAAVQVRSYSAPADRTIPAAKQKYVPTSGTYPKGFLAGSAFAGVKASNTKYDDLALIASEIPCPASAVFTQNIFKAAPVQVSQQILRDTGNPASFRGVIVNSGCANAVTGVQGREHAEIMARATDQAFNTGGGELEVGRLPSTLVMSTGVIGQKLPIEKITRAIPELRSNLGNTHEHWLNAANAICTTDTFPKLLSRQFTLPSHPDTTYSIAGMTKGAGMIHPNMATLLAIVCTDAKIDPASMRPLLKLSVGDSFNSISIDGDTSTNDSLAFFANGAAAPENTEAVKYKFRNVPAWEKGDRSVKDSVRQAGKQPEDITAFAVVLGEFLKDLAKLVVRDGEGATKFVTIRVQSDVSHNTAKRAAVSIARSALVKTALYGKDANWGRILCAVGYAPGIMSSRELSVPDLLKGMMVRTKTKRPYHGMPQVVPEMTSVSFIPADGSEPLRLLVRGEPQEVDEVRAKQILEMEDLEILVRLNDAGSDVSAAPPHTHEAVFWTCDMSHEYVTINGDYRT